LLRFFKEEMSMLRLKKSIKVASLEEFVMVLEKVEE